jgi:hypothetical protein
MRCAFLRALSGYQLEFGEGGSIGLFQFGWFSAVMAIAGAKGAIASGTSRPSEIALIPIHPSLLALNSQFC